MTTKELIKKDAIQEKAIVKWKGEQITVSFYDVKNLICPHASDQEAIIFLRTCQSLQLNPFANEIYLIKYSEKDKAAIVIAIDSYLKSAEVNDNFNGHEAGIILRDSGGKLEFREGSFILPDEMDKLVGGWARIYRKDRQRAFYMAVNKAECLRYTRDGNLTQFWIKEKQPSMLRKTALKRGLVEAFPSLFAGTLSNVEVEIMPEELMRVVPKPKGETLLEGELPPAYEKVGEPDWKLWWVRQKERGLSEDQVHSILGIASLKTDWIEKGRTLEEAEDIINDALEKTKVAKAQSAPTIAQEVKDLYGPDAAVPKPGVTDEPAKKQAPMKRDPASIKTLTDLMRACFLDFKLQPKDVIKDLGYSSQADISESPAECYRKIAGARIAHD